MPKRNRRSRRTDVVHKMVLTKLHLLCVALMGAVFVIGSTVFSVIDHDTLKPGDGFPPWLKTLSFYSNIPIKLGAVHGFLYGIELYRDGELFTFHVGQRLSTLWVQFFENPRWGQHLHMQTETLLQIVDVFQSEKAQSYSALERYLLIGCAVLFVLTNLITSIAYHTFEEQLIGFLLTLVKLFLDYDIAMPYNKEIGSAVKSVYAIAGGVVMIALALALTHLTLSSTLILTIDKFILHPTVIATSIFISGVVYHFIEDNYRTK